MASAWVRGIKQGNLVQGEAVIAPSVVFPLAESLERFQLNCFEYICRKRVLLLCKSSDSCSPISIGEGEFMRFPHMIGLRYRYRPKE